MRGKRMAQALGWPVVPLALVIPFIDTSPDDEVITKLQEAVERYPAYGFSKLFKILRRWGHPWNHNRIYRVYTVLNLNKRRRGKKRLPARNPEPLVVPSRANTVGQWTLCATACSVVVVSGRLTWSTTSIEKYSPLRLI